MNSLALIVAQTPSTARDGLGKPLVARTSLLVVIALAFVGGMLLTDGAATASVIAGAGWEWARLLRAMAALKLLFAGAGAAAVWLRLGVPISVGNWSVYALAAGASWAGPGLIWGLSHIVLGALLLHGGLIATAVLVWRDPATRARLSEVLDRRRAASRARN